MDNVSDLRIKDDPLKIAYSEEVFTIVKKIGNDNIAISLTPAQAAQLSGKLMEYLQPRGTAANFEIQN